MTGAFCPLVGCRLPIQQAGMSRVATPALAAAVAEAGGLGMLAFARQPAAAVQAQIDDVRARTSAPVGATFVAQFLDPATLAYAAERLPVIDLFWGWPDVALGAARRGDGLAGRHG